MRNEERLCYQYRLRSCTTFNRKSKPKKISTCFLNQFLKQPSFPEVFDLRISGDIYDTKKPLYLQCSKIFEISVEFCL